MSTPYESPDPEQPGAQPPAGGQESRPASDSSPESRPGEQQGPPDHQQPGYQQGPPAYQQPGYQQGPPGYQQGPPGYQQGPPGYPQQATPGYQQPGYQQGPPGYQQQATPGYQQPGYQQGPPSYQQPPSGQQGGYVQRPKSPAGDFSRFPERLRDLTSVPREVKNAYLLFVAGTLLNVLANLVNLILSGSRHGAFMVGFAVVGFIFSIIFAAVFIWFALLMKEGVGWARIVLIVLAALSVISGLFSLIGVFASALSLINLLGYVAIVIGGIMLLLPPAQAYFKARRPQGYLQ